MSATTNIRAIDEARGAQLQADAIKNAGYYRYLTSMARGLGYESLTDALADVAKRQSAAPPASSDLLTAARALATRYLKAQHDDASLCVNAAHHKAVCDLFAEIERAEKGGVA